MIGALSAYGMNAASAYGMYGSYGTYGTDRAGEQLQGMQGVSSGENAREADDGKTIKNPGESTKVQPGKKSSPAECETCKERKYKDGSDEMVSFKSAAHISPNAAASAVRSHEQEHVSNAYKKAAEGNGQVVNCSVSIHTAICPECGRSYVSGGTTQTSIKYSNESNPYVQNLKSAQGAALKGSNVDLAV